MIRPETALQTLPVLTAVPWVYTTCPLSSQSIILLLKSDTLTSHMCMKFWSSPNFISFAGIFFPLNGPNITLFPILVLENTPIWSCPTRDGTRYRLLGRLALAGVFGCAWLSSIHSSGPWSGQSPKMQGLPHSSQTKGGAKQSWSIFNAPYHMGCEARHLPPYVMGGSSQFDSHGNFMIMHTHRAAAHISEVFVKQNVLLALWATTLLISTNFVLHHFSLYL